MQCKSRGIWAVPEPCPWLQLHMHTSLLLTSWLFIFWHSCRCGKQILDTKNYKQSMT